MLKWVWALISFIDLINYAKKYQNHSIEQEEKKGHDLSKIGKILDITLQSLQNNNNYYVIFVVDKPTIFVANIVDFL